MKRRKIIHRAHLQSDPGGKGGENRLPAAELKEPRSRKPRARSPGRGAEDQTFKHRRAKKNSALRQASPKAEEAEDVRSSFRQGKNYDTEQGGNQSSLLETISLALGDTKRKELRSLGRDKLLPREKAKSKNQVSRLTRGGEGEKRKVYGTGEGRKQKRSTSTRGRDQLVYVAVNGGFENKAE